MFGRIMVVEGVLGMAKAYSGLACVYDYLLCGVDYGAWADYLEEIFVRFRIQPCRDILDLACGTGSSTFPWAKRGYRVHGVDISEEMLAIARQRARESDPAVTFCRQDMRSLQLPFQTDVIVLYQDGLNYLLTAEDLKKALRSIRTVLRPGGFFIFNLNLVEKLPASETPEVAWLEDEEITLIWESSLDPAQKIWSIKLTAFLLREKGLYERIQEEHKERSYSREELEPLLFQTGWQLKSCYKAFTFDEPGPGDRNIFYVVQREA